jgi:hypothetical protein
MTFGFSIPCLLASFEIKFRDLSRHAVAHWTDQSDNVIVFAGPTHNRVESYGDSYL